MSNATQEALAALDANPQDAQALVALERALTEEQAWSQLVEVVPERARAQADLSVRVRMLVRASHVQRYELEDESGAALLNEAVGAGLAGEALVEAFLAAYEPDTNWKAAVGAMIDAYSACDDKATRARLLHGAGHTYEDRLFDRERAIPFYQKAFKEDPTFTEPLEAARAIYRHTEHWGTVAKLYNVELKVTVDNRRKAEILKELGDLQKDKLKDWDNAMERYREALAVDASLPGLKEAIASLESAMSEDAEGVVIADELLGSSGSATPAAGSAAAAPASRAAAAPAARRPAAGGAARGRKEEPEVEIPAAPAVEPRAARLVVPATDAAADSRDYADSLVDAARAASGRSATELYQRAIARMVALDVDTDEVVEVIAEAVTGAADPVVAVRDLLPALADRRFTWQATLDHLVDGGADPAAIYAVAFYGAGNRDKAQEYREQAGVWGEIDGAALVWADKGNWRKVQQTLEQAWASDENPEAAAYRHQAWICIGLDNGDKAVDSLRRVLRKYKTDREALELSAAIYRSEDKSNQLVDALKTLVGELHEDDRQYKLLLLEEMVTIYRDELKQDLMVVNAYQQMLDVDPTNLRVMDALAGMLTSMNRYPDLVEVLKRKADAVEDEATRIDILTEVATLYEERFSNQAEAIKAWEAVVEARPAHETGLEKLDGLYEKRREWDKLIDIKRRRAELQGGDEATARIREAAEVAATRMRDQDLAMSLWNEVLALDPGDSAALGALEQLYERGKDWASLADIVARRVASLETPKDRAAAWLKLGQLYGDRLGQPAEALDAWEHLLEIEPENFRAKDAVRKAYVDLGRWDDLEAFYERDGAWAEYVRQVESLAGSVDDADVQVDLLFRAANTYTDRLETPERATRALERILQIDERNVEAARRLVPIYDERSDTRKLPAVMEIVLEAATDGEERFSLLSRLAGLHAESLRDPATGLRYYVEALAERPNAIELYEPMQGAAERCDGWQTVDAAWAEARDRMYGDSANQDAWLDLTRRHTRALEEQLADLDGALDAADAILSVLPEDNGALATRERIFRQRQDWDALLDVLNTRRELASSDDERAALLLQICEIHETRRDDPFSAIDRYRDLLVLRPGDRGALEALQRLLRATEQYEDFAEVTATLIAQSDDAARSQLELDLATVYVQELGRVEDAVGLLQTVIGRDQRNVGARQLLEALLDDESVRATVAAVLRPVYEAESNWRAVVQMLEIQLEDEQDNAVRAQLLTRIGELQTETLRDLEAAFDAWSRVLEVDATSVRARQQVEAIAERDRDFEKVVALYEGVLDNLPVGTADEQELAILYAERIATFYDEKLGALDDAIGMHQRILQIDGGRWSSRNRLAEDLFPRAERWTDLVDLHQESLQLVETADDRRDLRFRIVELHEHRLDDPDSAILTLNEVLGEFPTDSAALEGLDRLHGVTGDSGAQVDVVNRRIELAAPGSSEQLGLKQRMAALYEEALGDIDGALRVLSEIVEVSPRHEGARQSLERLLGVEDAAVRASEILEPLYVADEDDAGLNQALAVRYEYLQDPAERRALVHRLAVLQSDRLGDHAASFATLERGLREFPEDAELLDDIYRRAEVIEAWAELAGLMDELADEVSDPERQSDLRERVARLRQEKLGDVSAAADSWRQVLEVDPENAAALDALDGIYEGAGLWTELVEIIQRKAEVAGDSPEGAALTFRAAAVLEQRLEEVEEAIEVIRSLSMRDPANRRALDELQRLYEQLGRWDDLVDVLETKIGLAQSADERRALAFHAGAVLEDALSDDDRAAGQYRRVLEELPEDGEALAALDRICVRTENWTELLDVLGRQAALAAEQGDRLALELRAARVHEVELADLGSALPMYARILQQDENFTDARVAVEEIVGRGEMVAEAAALLEPIYRRQELWSELINLNEVLLDAVYEPERRGALLAENASLFEHRLGDQTTAYETWKRAAQEGASRETFNHLERLAAALEAWEDIAELLADAREEVAEPELRRDLGLRLATIREEQLGDLEGAIEAHARVHEESPEDTTALEALDRLYQQVGNWEALVDVLQKRIYSSSNPTEQNQLRQRMATIHAEFLEDGQEAIRILRELLESEPGSPDALATLEGMATSGTEIEEIAGILEPIYRERGSWQELLSLYENRNRYLDMPEERYALWAAGAEIYERELTDLGAAIGAWGYALTELPGDVPAREAIERIAAGNDLWIQAVETYRAVLQGDVSDDDRAELASRYARIATEHLADPSLAEEGWMIALEVQPEDAQALAALDVLYVAQDRWEEVSDVLARRREVEFDSALQVELAFRHAEVFEHRLADIESAERVYNETLELQPDHEAALTALERIYVNGEQWEQLYDVYDRQAQLAQEPAQRELRVRLMARLCVHQLQRFDDAVDLWNRLLGEAPTDREALESLTELYHSAEMYHELVDVLRRRVDLTEEPAERMELLRLMGALLAWTLEQDHDAVPVWEQVLALDETDAEALAALRILYERTGDEPSLARTLETLLALEQIPAEGLLEAWERLGYIYSDTLNQPDDAIRAWTSVNAIDPSHEEALNRLDELYTSAARWEDLVGVLEKKAVLAGIDVEHEDEDYVNQDAIDLMRRVAHIWTNEQPNVSLAATAWERILDLDLGDLEAATALEGLYPQLENWTSLVSLHVDRLEVLEDEWERRETMRKAAAVYRDRLGELEGSYLLLRKALEEAPLDEELRAEVEAAAAAADRWADLDSCYATLRDQVTTDDGPEAALPLTLARARVLDAQLNNATLAIGLYESALEVDEENELALSALEDIYNREEDWEMLVDVLRRRSVLAFEPDAQITLFKRIASIHEELRSDLAEATRAWRDVLDVNDAETEALDNLERILEARGEWRDLIDILDRRAAVTYEPEAVTVLRFRMGELWRDKVREDDAAIDAFSEVIMSEPAHIPALEALEALYGRNERWDDYIAVLDSRIQVDTEPETQVALLNKQASVHEAVFQDVDQAVNCLQRALMILEHDLDTIDVLERIFVEQERWYDLVEVYERHVRATDDDAEKSTVLVAMGDTFCDHLEDQQSAATAWERALELNPTEAHALSRTAEVYERLGEFARAVDRLDRLAEGVTEHDAALATLERSGLLLEQQLGDLPGAAARYQLMLERDADSIAALDGIFRTHCGMGRWDEAISAMRTRIELTVDMAERSRLFAQLAEVYGQHLGDVENARNLYEEAIELDPSNVFAAAPLADIFMSEERWERARPLLELLVVDEQYAGYDEHLAQLRFMLGRCCEELAADDEAVDEYRRVLEYDPNHAQALPRLARIQLRLGNTGDAYNAAMDYISAWQSQLAPAELADAWCLAGDIRAAEGDALSAQQHYESALTLDENHGGALRGLVELSGDLDPAAVVSAKSRLLGHATDPVERFKLLTDIGDAYSQLGEYESAAQNFKAALELQPNSKVALSKMLKVYQDTQNWKRATEVLGRIAAIEDNPGRKARILHAIGAMFRDELGDQEKAYEFFNLALDNDPSHLVAFQDIDAMVTASRDWKQLEKAYVTMLERIAQDTSEKAFGLRKTLLSNLGEIYNSRIQSPRRALQAFKLASNIDPNDEALLEKLAALYAQEGESGEEAIELQRRLIALSPFRMESYRALFEAYLRNSDIDRAWCMSSAIVVMGKANANEEAVYGEGASQRLAAPRKALGKEQWRALWHPEMDPNLTEIFQHIAINLKPYAADIRDFGINKRKDKIELEGDQTPLTRQVQAALRALTVAPPILYSKTDYLGLRNANSDPPSLIVGHDMRTAKPERELAFEVGKAIALLRPELYIGSALPSSEHLRTILAAALAVRTGQIVGTNNVEAAQQIAQEIMRLPDQIQLQIQQAVQRLLESGANPDVSAWLRGIDHTASRVGLLFCGDLRTAMSMVKDEQNPIGKATAKDKVRELIVFAISEEYFTLREELGLSLKG